MSQIDDNCRGPCGREDPCSPFARVQVIPTIQHGTVVSWTLRSGFSDAGTYIYQLQVGTTGLAEADDWEDVGDPTPNVGTLTDPAARDFGQTRYAHYRVKITTDDDTYYSLPQHAWGNLDFEHWRLWRARERQWEVRLYRTAFGRPGKLLKRRTVGPQPDDDNVHVDYLTGQIINADSELTRGTDRLEGYFDPLDCVYAGLTELSRREEKTSGEKGPMNEQLKVTGTLLAYPQLDSYDVWVDDANDFRYMLHTIRHLEEIRGLPIVVQADMRMLPFDHPVYKIPLV